MSLASTVVRDRLGEVKSRVSALHAEERRLMAEMANVAGVGADATGLRDRLHAVRGELEESYAGAEWLGIVLRGPAEHTPKEHTCG